MLFSAVRVPAWPPAADDLAGETRAQPPSARRHLDGGRCRPRHILACVKSGDAKGATDAMTASSTTPSALFAPPTGRPSGCEGRKGQEPFDQPLAIADEMRERARHEVDGRQHLGMAQQRHLLGHRRPANGEASAATPATPAERQGSACRRIASLSSKKAKTIAWTPRFMVSFAAIWEKTDMMNTILQAWWIWAVPLAFVAVLVYAFSPKRKKQFEEEAKVPLEDEPPLK